MQLFRVFVPDPAGGPGRIADVYAENRREAFARLFGDASGGRLVDPDTVCPPASPERCGPVCRRG